MLYRKEDSSIISVAALLGCKAGSGLVNQINDLNKDRQEGVSWSTIGDIYKAVCRDNFRKSNGWAKNA